MAFRKFLLLLSLATFLALGACTNEQNENVYSNQGFSISPAPDWVFSRDDNPSLLGGREVAFKIGEFSSISFYIRDKSLSLPEFSAHMLEKTLLADKSNPSDITKDINSKISGFASRELIISSHLIDSYQTEAIFVDVPKGKQQVFGVLFLADSDQYDFRDELSTAIESIEVTR
ncbi:hypothetical protein QWY82_08180 [Simiduia curdlanivorans]|uniref:Lipoprotein n=1 Tax=Simiduia curdlanivorans TaxID=1492769 RepID=A0ABV8V8P5_9GAMM|nr:hypothetical protein [Simiduia curdlanivorans]MDN3638782.1 hypothetical protein [Simiduia curdlanivorans]